MWREGLASVERTVDGKERRLLLQAGLQQAVIGLQGRIIAGADPLALLGELLRLLIDVTGSAAGLVAEGLKDAVADNAVGGVPVCRWHPISTVNLAAGELSDPMQLLSAGIARDGGCVALGGEELTAVFGQVRPGCASVWVTPLMAGSGLLCLLDRPGGYDADILDIVRPIAEVADQFLAASHRRFVRQGDAAPAPLAQARLGEILGDMAGAVWSASLPDFVIDYMSPSVEKLLGHRADDFLARREFLDEITPPEDQVLRLAALDRALDGEAFDLVHRLICADGSVRWIRAKANVIGGHDGRPVRLDGTLNDVTAERLTVERGRQSDALYRAVVEDQQEAIVRFRPDHVITFANRQYAEFYNLAPEDLLGVKLSDLLAPHELKEVFDHLDRLTLTQPLCVHEYEKPLPGGGQRWLRWVNRALFDALGAVSEYQCVGHDIGDIKRLESELEDGREMLSLAVASSGDGIFEWHVEGNYVWFSPRWKEIFGYADDELPNSLATWERLVDPVDRLRILNEIDAYLRRPEGVLRTTGRYRHRNGSTVYIESRVISRQGKPGAKTRLVGAMTDITAKVVADQRMQDAIESLSDGFAWFDPNDRMIMHNQRFLEFFPFLAGLGTLSGLPFIDMVRHPDGEMGRMPDPESYVAERMKRHWEGGSFELPLHSGGWVRVSERRTKEGGIVSIWSDITELKRAQQRLTDAVAAMQEGFILVGPDNMIQIANQRCREIYPIAGHLLEAGRSYADFLRYGAENGEFLEAVGRADDYIAEVLRLLHSDENVRIERPLADGRWVLISQRRMSDGSVVGIRTDLTPQKRREAELESAHKQLEKQARVLVDLAEKLEEARLSAVEASRAKTRFLAHMSHELRTPLNAVLGFTRLMGDELFGPIGVPKYKEYIGLIHESGAHLLSLINDVLDLSKIEAGRMELDRREISVTELTGSSTRLMEGLAKDRQIKLEVHVMPDCPTIYGDERALKQMVINLLSNALKFTHGGGRVSLSIARQGDGGTAMTVVDTGIGMTAEDIVKALDPFGQVDGEIARQHHGTGLGLPLVKAMAEAHGGSLSIDSVPGVGTTMTVHLPGPPGVAARSRLEPAATAAPPSAGQAPAPRREAVIDFPSLADSLAPAAPAISAPASVAAPALPRLLLAEDNVVNRRLVLDILKELPVAVDCVANGEEAVRAVAANDYLLVLMDIQMPVMDGITATERIRASGHGSADLPVVALTAHASEADQQRFTEVGMDGYLAKPFDVAALMKLVQKHLVAAKARAEVAAQAG
jgi:PAS domain S-box-containing protein